MNKKCLPDDIRKYICRKIVSRILGFAVLEILVIAFLVTQSERIVQIAGRADLIITSVVLVVLPFLIMEIPFKFIDSTWRGVVVDIKLRTTIDFAPRFLAGKGIGGIYYKNTLLLKVKKENQKIVNVKALELGVKSGITTLFTDGVIFGRIDDHIDNFRIGDIVYHFYGLKRPVIIHKSQNQFTYCAICGCRNFSEDDICSRCGHSLIKYIE